MMKPLHSHPPPWDAVESLPQQPCLPVIEAQAKLMSLRGRPQPLNHSCVGPSAAHRNFFFSGNSLLLMNAGCYQLAALAKGCLSLHAPEQSLYEYMAMALLLLG